ncbi:hypothetical protein NM688_g6669 [Phlebia brevispora]|uniref:Uncharacterized protein n=1 Tax=Phlebia brevispora TaxID=194682 RepID=A0ACC1SDS4_9APHY|nr:hypothetical protein NM688_g6669 [Phlebia brevispora]
MLWNACTQGAPTAPEYTRCWVDVRDLAYAHVEALMKPELGGRRYTIAAPGHFTIEQAVNIVRKHFPWVKGEPVEEEEPNMFTIEGEAAAEDLGIHYRLSEDTVIESIGQFRQIQLHENAA